MTQQQQQQQHVVVPISRGREVSAHSAMQMAALFGDHRDLAFRDSPTEADVPPMTKQEALRYIAEHPPAGVVAVPLHSVTPFTLRTTIDIGSEPLHTAVSRRFPGYKDVDVVADHAVTDGVEVIDGSDEWDVVVYTGVVHKFSNEEDAMEFAERHLGEPNSVAYIKHSVHRKVVPRIISRVVEVDVTSASFEDPDKVQDAWLYCWEEQ